MKPASNDAPAMRASNIAVSFMAVFGPGIALAATGVGAGDVTTTGIGAARMGLGLLWVPVLAAVLKYYLNEGMARYQLVTGRPFLHVWGTEFGNVVRYGFFIYLLTWLIPVFATSITASGVAMDMLLPLEDYHAAFSAPVFSGGPRQADVIWSLAIEVGVVILLWTGGYKFFESSMALCAALMTVAAIGGAAALISTTRWEINKLLPTRMDEVGLCLAIMAGVGGTVTMVAYGSWIEEHGRDSATDLRNTRIDLVASYLFTGGFGVCMILIVGGANDETWTAALGHAPTHTKLGLRESFKIIGYRLEHESILPPGLATTSRLIFGIGLLATVLSTLIGILQCIPTLLLDYYCVLRKYDDTFRRSVISDRSISYRLTVLACATIPCALVCLRQPAQIVYAYAIYASLFLPFAAATLLWLNNQRTILGRHVNSFSTNLWLAACLFIFAMAAVISIWHPFT